MVPLRVLAAPLVLWLRRAPFAVGLASLAFVALGSPDAARASPPPEVVARAHPRGTLAGDNAEPSSPVALEEIEPLLGDFSWEASSRSGDGANGSGGAPGVGDVPRTGLSPTDRPFGTGASLPAGFLPNKALAPPPPAHAHDIR